LIWEMRLRSTWKDPSEQHFQTESYNISVQFSGFVLGKI
jgi:hypothetical protein